MNSIGWPFNPGFSGSCYSLGYTSLSQQCNIIIMDGLFTVHAAHYTSLSQQCNIIIMDGLFTVHAAHYTSLSQQCKVGY